MSRSSDDEAAGNIEAVFDSGEGNKKNTCVNFDESFHDDIVLCGSSSLPASSTAQAIYVEKSNDVQIGHKVYYNGPVTININTSKDQVKSLTHDKIYDNTSKAGFVTTGYTIADSSLKIVDREDWFAQPPTEEISNLTHPVPYVIISHTCTPPDATVRSIQSFHIDGQGWEDVAYNFLVGGCGHVYVGRGWDKEGTHTYRYNGRSIGITFIGNYCNVLPPNTHLIAAQQLIEIGVKLGKISPNYKLLGHCQVCNAESPGRTLFKEIKSWPHWSCEP